MDIPALSQTIGVGILKKANNQFAQEGQALVQMMEQSVQPNLGINIDIKA
jgi:hypothetical protein